MMKLVLCACLALVSVVLHGCGGGGGPSPAPPPPPSTPLVTKSPYVWTTKDGTLTLAWEQDTDSLQVSLTTDYNGTMTPGWLSVGFAPAGKMASGDFVMGYTTDKGS